MTQQDHPGLARSRSQLTLRVCATAPQPPLALRTSALPPPLPAPPSPPRRRFLRHHPSAVPRPHRLPRPRTPHRRRRPSPRGRTRRPTRAHGHTCAVAPPALPAPAAPVPSTLPARPPGAVGRRPTAAQRAIILQGKGKDVLAKANTGTGKTVAFLLPAIEVLSTLPHQRNQLRPPINLLEGKKMEPSSSRRGKRKALGQERDLKMVDIRWLA